MTDSKIVEEVRKQYSSVATLGLSSDHEGICSVAEAFGYTVEELRSIPAEANMGLSCGNPIATARLREGEVIVDLGSGGGLDVFLAAAKVGPSGRAIGIDMSEEMLTLARRNALKGANGEAYENVEFHRATIDNLPLDDASVDCVISNCVINLAPDKPAVFREIFRILKPGGRLAVSDIALTKHLPSEVQEDLAAYIGCIGGAIEIGLYRSQLHEAGFSGVEVVGTGADLNAYAKAENASCCIPSDDSRSVGNRDAIALPTAQAGSCCGGSASDPTRNLHSQLADLLRRYNVNDFAASVRVFAVKA